MKSAEIHAQKLKNFLSGSPFLAFILSFLFLFLIEFFTYIRLTETYFQQDEWNFFGLAIYADKYGIINLFKISGFHFIPLASYFAYAFYKLNGLQSNYYASFSITINLLNAFLIFYLAYILVKNKSIAFLSSVLFLTANNSQQAITWYAASLNILPATLFGILSIILFVKWIEKYKKKFMFLSLLSLLIGLGFKEDLIALFLFYPLLIIVLKDKNFLKKISLLIAGGLSYVIFRIVIQLANKSEDFSIRHNFLSYLITTIFNAVILPIKTFSLIYVPETLILSIGYSMIKGKENLLSKFLMINNLDLFIIRTIMPLIEIILSILIILILLYFYKKSLSKNSNDKKIFLFLIFFLILSLLPFAFLPGTLGIESRHLYFPMVGGSILLAFIAITSIKKVKYLFLKVAIAMVLTVYVLTNIELDRQQVNFFVIQSKPRMYIVNQIQKKYISIPPKVIFYSSGDQLPFQSGMGEMLLVLLHKQQPYYPFLKEEFLWDLGSQGYKEHENIGFGYFYDYNKFKNTYKKYKLKPENVFSFNWSNQNQKLTDTSKEIRTKLQND